VGRSVTTEYRRGRRLGADEGGGSVAFLVVLVVAVVVVVLVMRAAAAAPGGGPRAPRGPHPTRRPARFVAPDDDPDFLRELERRTRRDDGSPA
jgi:hypothetical protein